jgi:translation elongation factor EF-G
MVLRKVDDREPLSLYVFKTMSDPFAGRISFFKVFSGIAKSDATVTNYTHRSAERLAHLTVMQGRTAMPIGSCTRAIWAPWPSCARPLPATRWGMPAMRFTLTR